MGPAAHLVHHKAREPAALLEAREDFLQRRALHELLRRHVQQLGVCEGEQAVRALRGGSAGRQAGPSASAPRLTLRLRVAALLRVGHPHPSPAHLDSGRALAQLLLDRHRLRRALLAGQVGRRHAAAAAG